MFNSIIAKAKSDAKSEVTKLFEKYQSTFKVETASLPVQKVATEPFRLRGRSFLFTYNLCRDNDITKDCMVDFLARVANSP